MPRNFKPVSRLASVRLTPEPAFISQLPNGTTRGRRRQGILFEERVHDHMMRLYGSHYLPSPWFSYRECGNRKVKWCQPDGLLFDPGRGRITIIEAKLQHTREAYFQLFWRYLPVVTAAFGGKALWEVSCCEVTQWYDPDVVVPCAIEVIPEVGRAKTGLMSVFVLGRRQ